MTATHESYRVVLLSVDRPGDVERLSQEIQRQAGASGADPALVCVTTDARAIDAAADPGSPSTVVVIVSGSVKTSQDEQIRRAVEACARHVVPVFVAFDPHVPRVPYERQAPADLVKVNGIGWRRGGAGAERVASLVLRLVGLAESERRIFLSYRQKDGAALAEQLRRALLDDGWDVFLDRFSVPPAVDFQQRLERELGDKAFVLLIETPCMSSSRWVDHEIAFALSHGLGLYSLVLPTTQKEHRSDRFDDAFRGFLRTPELTGPIGYQELTTAALGGHQTVIHEKHAASHRLRRENLVESTTTLLDRAGYHIQLLGASAVLATRPDRREVVHMTTRIPRPTDLRAVAEARDKARQSGSPCRGWVVHALEDPDEDRVSLMRWLLASRRQLSTTPIFELARRIT